MSQQATNPILTLAVAAAAALALPAVARAQDTAQQAQDTSMQAQDTTRQAQGDTSQWGYPTDTSGVQNPPGYRGMERPTNVFPPDTAGDTTEQADVGDRVTGTYQDSAWDDTTGAKQNPPGYRGMERPVGEDTSAAGQQDTSATGQHDTGAAGQHDTNTTGRAAEETSGGDTTRVGETTPKTPEDPTRRLPAARDDTTGQADDQMTDTLEN